MFISLFCPSICHNRSSLIQKAKKNQETVISLAIVCFIINIYIISLAISALGLWYTNYNKHCNDAKSNTLDNIYRCRVNRVATITTFIFDTLWIIIIALYICSLKIYFGCKEKAICREACEKDSMSEYTISTLLLIVLWPIFCVIAHSPYIAIAYLNDGYHASSIFIYYTTLVYIFFGVTKLFVHWIHHVTKAHKCSTTIPTSQQGDENCESIASEPHRPVTQYSSSHSNYSTQNGDASDGVSPLQDNNTSHCPQYCCNCAFISALLFLAILFLLGLVVLIVCYLVLIPINKAVSDAPNRLLSIYQSGGFLIGSFILYKIIFYFYNNKKVEEERRERRKELFYDILKEFEDEMERKRSNLQCMQDSPA